MVGEAADVPPPLTSGASYAMQRSVMLKEALAPGCRRGEPGEAPASAASLAAKSRRYAPARRRFAAAAASARRAMPNAAGTAGAPLSPPPSPPAPKKIRSSWRHESPAPSQRRLKQRRDMRLRSPF